MRYSIIELFLENTNSWLNLTANYFIK